MSVEYTRVVFAMMTGLLSVTPHLDSQGHQKNAQSFLRADENLRGITFVAGSVNGASTPNILVDTGAGSSSVNAGAVERLALTTVAGQASVSGNSAMQVRVIPEGSIAIGGSAMVTGRFAVFPLEDLEAIFGRPIDAIVGGDLLRSYVVEFDFSHKVLLLDSLHSPLVAKDAAAMLPLVLHDNIPYVELTVELPNGKRAEGKFCIDTGAAGVAIQLYQPVADRKGWMTHLQTISETSHGIGGNTHNLATRATSVAIGHYRLLRPTIAFTEDYDEAHTAPGAIGLIGIELLRRFRVTFDYPGKQVAFEPNSRLKEPFIYDAAGMRLRSRPVEPKSVVVSRVVENSSAAAAGIRPGDALLALDHKSTADLSLDEIKNLLHEPGKTHILVVRRGDRAIELTMKTKDLLP